LTVSLEEEDIDKIADLYFCHKMRTARLRLTTANPRSAESLEIEDYGCKGTKISRAISDPAP
jgi:hypothetical protein